ncbi:MAG: hypothetical protein ACI9KS_000910 [Sulfitobacter sp.]|jgi:hypothetical protein
MTASLFPFAGITLLAAPGAGHIRVSKHWGSPSHVARGFLPENAPRAITLVRHPFERFAAVLTQARKSERWSKLTEDDAVQLLAKTTGPYDTSHSWAGARLRGQLLPQVHPWHALHAGADILQVERWEELGADLGLPKLPRPASACTLLPETKVQLAVLYEQDFETFGYSPDSLDPVGAPQLPTSPGPTMWAAWPAMFDDGNYSSEMGDAFLPAVDVDFSAFKTARIDTPHGPDFTTRRPNLAQHMQKLQPEQSGNMRLTHLLLSSIVVLRRSPENERARALFHRILAEESEVVLPELTYRWLRSVGDTLSDHGETWADRMIGLCVTLMLMQVKLSETERKVYDPPRPWPPNKRWSKGGAILDGEKTYWVEKGDMVSNTWARLRKVLAAAPDCAAGPLLVETLSRIESGNTPMGRLASMYGKPSPPLIAKPGRDAITQLIKARL